MKNKNLLIGAGVVVVGYLLWKKSQNKVNKTQYSKECYESLQGRLMQEDVKPPNFEKDFLENCEKSKNKPTQAQSKKYSTECEIRYSQLMQPSVVMPQEYWKKKKEDWMKINCK